MARESATISRRQSTRSKARSEAEIPSARSTSKTTQGAGGTRNGDGLELSGTQADEREGSASPSLTGPKKKPRKSAAPISCSLSAPRKDDDVFAAVGIPSNTSVPETLTFEAKPEGCVRIVSWNITSLKSAESKGMSRYIQAEDPDVLVLTETKINEAPMFHPSLSPRYPHAFWGIGTQKGYAGVALLSKVKPSKVIFGFSDDAASKGRISKSESFMMSTSSSEGNRDGIEQTPAVTAEFATFTLIGTYVVNAGEGLKTLAEKQAWNTQFAKHVGHHQSTLRSDGKPRPIIWCGDLNVVLDERDLTNAKKKWNKSPGYTEIECEAHRNLLRGGEEKASGRREEMVDVWRELHPTAEGHFTFYGWRGMCRSKGIGWRLDSFIVSKSFQDRVKACEIRHEVYGASDHVPVVSHLRVLSDPLFRAARRPVLTSVGDSYTSIAIWKASSDRECTSGLVE